MREGGQPTRGRVSPVGCPAERLAASSALVESPRTRYAKSGEVHIAYQLLGEDHGHIVYVQGALPISG